MLNCSMSSVYDFLKEYLYYFFGPPAWLRPLCLLPTAAVGAAAFLPFDNIKVRMHNMRALPNGQMPYTGFRDALMKVNNFQVYSQILYFECHRGNYSSEAAMLSGFAPTFIKIYSLLLMVKICDNPLQGVYISDYVFNYNYLEGELWEGHTAYSTPELIHIRHDPYNTVVLNQKYYSDEAMKPKKSIPLDKKNPNTYVQI